MYWYMSLTQPGNPVYLWDGDGWDFPEEQSPEVGIVAICSSLAEWFDRWADGRSLVSAFPVRQDQPRHGGTVSGHDLAPSRADGAPWIMSENDPWIAATGWEHEDVRDLTREPGEESPCGGN